MPALHHRQGVEELAAEVGRAARFPGQGRQRLEDRCRALHATVARFDTPEGDQEARLYAELLLGAREERLVVDEQFLAAIDHDRRQARVGVSAEAGVELGLAAVALDDPLEGLESGQRLLDEAVAEAFAAGFGQSVPPATRRNSAARRPPRLGRPGQRPAASWADARVPAWVGCRTANAVNKASQRIVFTSGITGRLMAAPTHDYRRRCLHFDRQSRLITASSLRYNSRLLSERVTLCLSH